MNRCRNCRRDGAWPLRRQTCPRCYGVLRRAVAAGTTSWAELEHAGLSTPPQHRRSSQATPPGSAVQRALAAIAQYDAEKGGADADPH
jgi:hypothetical protein